MLLLSIIIVVEFLSFIIDGMRKNGIFESNAFILPVKKNRFGTRRGDNCLVADFGGKAAGAVWARIMDDYGHVDDETPSIAISLYKEYRGQGIGSRMMQEMLEQLKAQGYKRVSLSVQKANYAVRMYKKLGFAIVDENEEEYIMVCELQGGAKI